MGMGYYRRDGSPIVETDLSKAALAWAKEFEDKNRHVASTKVGKYWVSTVFLGMDHSWGSGPPLIFETMVFNNDPDRDEQDMRDLRCDRYSTEEEALAGHLEILQQMRDGTFTDYSGDIVDTSYEIEEEPTLA